RRRLLRRVRVEQALDALCLVGFDARNPGVEVDEHAVAAHHVGALREHDVADQRDAVALDVEHAAVAARSLVLLRHPHVALRLGALDLLAAGPASALLRGLGRALLRPDRRRVVFIEDHQRLALKDCLALRELDAAHEGRLLALVAHLQRIRLDLDRLVAIHLEALHRAAGLLRGLRVRRDRQRQARQKRGEKARAHCEAPSGLAPSRSSTTPRSKRITSPESTISMRFALSRPLGSLISTGNSDTTLPFFISTAASRISAL